MRILAVDDKAIPRKVLVKAVEEAAPDADIRACASAAEVLAIPDVKSFDVAFVDIDMPGKNGIELALDLKRFNPCMNIVFATGYGEYMAEAFAMHSSGYLMKPITADAVQSELENLRFPLQEATEAKRGLYARCFGNFELFSNGEVVHFNRSKTKELFAYLVDRRGAVITMREAEAMLWETAPNGDSVSGSYLRTLATDMRRSLESYGHTDVLIRRRGCLGVDAMKISCDFYDFLHGEPAAINLWRGEYMSQYSWAELTKASLL